jgi:hypothetical protein
MSDPYKTQSKPSSISPQAMTKANSNTGQAGDITPLAKGRAIKTTVIHANPSNHGTRSLDQQGTR